LARVAAPTARTEPPWTSGQKSQHAAGGAPVALWLKLDKLERRELACQAVHAARPHLRQRRQALHCA
jgi:hypothetical protein